MGHRPSNHSQSNRPESGGANKDEQFEKSGLLEREKEKLGSARDEHPPQDPRDLERARERRREPGEVDRAERTDDSDPGHS